MIRIIDGDVAFNVSVYYEERVFRISALYVLFISK
jgi:hypothetical protein